MVGDGAVLSRAGWSAAVALGMAMAVLLGGVLVPETGGRTQERHRKKKKSESI